MWESRYNISFSWVQPRNKAAEIGEAANAGIFDGLEIEYTKRGWAHLEILSVNVPELPMAKTYEQGIFLVGIR